MKIERTKNASRNILFGSVLKIYQILIPFIMRTLMIYILGAGYTGLNSLFASILQVLNLAELGVGSAMVYSMYKPIAEDDKDTICALMRLYRTYYRVIGLVIAAAGMVLLPFIPHLIKSDIPQDMNVYVLYLMNLGATVLTYWLFAYKNSILTAYQRNDVISKITLFSETMKYVLQIGVLLIFKNYYYFVIVILATQIVNNILTAYIADKMFPEYKPVGKLEKEQIKTINGRIRDLFTSKVGTVIINSADSIVISTFLGLTMLTIYQNYFFPISAIIGFLVIIFNSCTAGIGNSIITETEEKNYQDLNKFTFIIAWIAGVCACCFLCLLQPFMEIWMGKKLMLNMLAVVCFTVYFFVYEINALLNLYKDAAGIWHEDRFRPLVTALSNLGMNLIMVNFIGIYGVILSTVISMLIVGMPWLLHNLFTVLFDRKYLGMYLARIFKYSVIVMLTAGVTYFICSFVNMEPMLTLIVRLVICAIIPNIIFLVLYRRTTEFKMAMQLFDKMTKGKIPFIKKLA